MMDPKLENTIGGGEENQMSEIKLGEATYIVHILFRRPICSRFDYKPTAEREERKICI